MCPLSVDGRNSLHSKSLYGVRITAAIVSSMKMMNLSHWVYVIDMVEYHLTERSAEATMNRNEKKRLPAANMRLQCKHWKPQGTKIRRTEIIGRRQGSWNKRPFERG